MLIPPYLPRIPKATDRPASGNFRPRRARNGSADGIYRYIPSCICGTFPDSFDKAALKVYKRIPVTGSCSLESLVDGEMSLREVMKYLLKLEMGGFVVMLPGECVSRKLK